MSTQPVFAQYVDKLREAGGLKGTDIANIADVSEATVSRWSKGTASPQPRTQLVLSDLHYVVNRLRDYYSRDEVRVWLFARQPSWAVSGQSISSIRESPRPFSR